MVNISKVTPVQEYIIARHSRLVGRILDLVEAAVPEGTQCEKLKKLVQIPLYDFRNEVLKITVNGELPLDDEI